VVFVALFFSSAGATAVENTIDLRGAVPFLPDATDDNFRPAEAQRALTRHAENSG
jgi:hypothetical protein